MIAEAGMFKIWWDGLVGQILREELQFKSKGNLLAEFLLAQGRSVFVLLRPLTD